MAYRSPASAGPSRPTAPGTTPVSPAPIPAASGGCDLSTMCMVCGTPMDAEHAHYRCPTCGWRDSCCM